LEYGDIVPRGTIARLTEGQARAILEAPEEYRRALLEQVKQRVEQGLEPPSMREIEEMWRSWEKELEEAPPVEEAAQRAAEEVGARAPSGESAGRICEGCGRWHPTLVKHDDGRLLCPECWAKATGKIREEKPEKPEKVEVRRHEAKRPSEPATSAQAPEAISEMELWVEEKLWEKGYKPARETIPVLTTTPDFILDVKGTPLAIYLDGEAVHKPREERDEYLRDLLAKRGYEVLSITYSRPTEEEKERVLNEIMDTIKRLEERGE